MKKTHLTPFSNLTASRKNRARRRTTRPGLAAMRRHCRAISTLAGLLLQSDEDGLSPELVGDAGALIDREAKQLRKLLAELGREAR